MAGVNARAVLKKTCITPHFSAQAHPLAPVLWWHKRNQSCGASGIPPRNGTGSRK
jgi:hypothetical protein